MLQKIKISGFGLSVALSFIGCGGQAERDYRHSSDTPAEAADHLSEAFANSKAKNHVAVASQSLQNGEYKKAVVAIQLVKTTPGMTLDQGIAIRDYLKNLSSELSERAEDGDSKAKDALQMLREMSRN